MRSDLHTNAQLLHAIVKSDSLQSFDNLKTMSNLPNFGNIVKNGPQFANDCDCDEECFSALRYGGNKREEKKEGTFQN